MLYGLSQSDVLAVFNFYSEDEVSQISSTKKDFAWIQLAENKQYSNWSFALYSEQSFQVIQGKAKIFQEIEGSFNGK